MHYWSHPGHAGTVTDMTRIIAPALALLALLIIAPSASAACEPFVSVQAQTPTEPTSRAGDKRTFTYTAHPCGEQVVANATWQVVDAADQSPITAPAPLDTPQSGSLELTTTGEGMQQVIVSTVDASGDPVATGSYSLVVYPASEQAQATTASAAIDERPTRPVQPLRVRVLAGRIVKRNRIARIIVRVDGEVTRACATISANMRIVRAAGAKVKGRNACWNVKSTTTARRVVFVRVVSGKRAIVAVKAARAGKVAASRTMLRVV